MLVVKVASEPSRHRVAVWRELRRVGAVQLGQGCWALPSVPLFVESVSRIVELVHEHDGDVLTLGSTPLDDSTEERLREIYDEARRAEWSEFEAECAKCENELAREIRIKKFTLAELDEEEQSVERLRRWHRELTVRDVFTSTPAAQTQTRLDDCVALLETFTHMVYEAVGLN